jgi:transitional endoplasmic reticulum ATPase
MAEKKEPMTLKVGELTNRDEIGRGIVRIDSKLMQKIGVREGDIVQVEGKDKTGAIAVRSYPSDIGLNVARIDGVTRKNTGVSIGENIKIRKVVVKDAKRVVLAPAQKGIRLQMDPEGMKKTLYMRPLAKGDRIRALPVVKQRRNDMFPEDFFSEFFGGGSVMGLPKNFEFMVVSASPGDLVRVTEETELEIKPEAVDMEQEAISTVTYEDIGGLHDAADKIREMVELPLRHPELFTKLGIEPPKGVLLYGPPGSGKTLLAKAVANESGANFFSIAGPEIMTKWYGGSEENVRKIFDEAQKSAPAIIFIDEIDSIAPKRGEVTGEVERRVVSQLLTMMDGLKSRGKVIVIAATNRPDALDPALRRGGRFDREIEIGVPDQKGRLEILQIHTRNMPLSKDVDLKHLASITYGYVGADLETLAKEAAMSALRRNLPGISWKKTEELPAGALDKLRVDKDDFQNALKMVEPSAMREVLVEVPNVKWDDVGGLEKVKSTLKETVEWPLENPQAFKNIGIRPPSGVLMYGPPGSGKTMLAKAVANEAGANFISVAGPELLSKWVGESEKHVREIFRRAKQVAPSIIFFDEIDALAPRRGSQSGTHVTENVVSQILTAMSGLEELHNVVVIAATNRPDMLDSALLRPGRFDRQILVPAPDEKARLEILKIHTKDMPLKGLNLKKVAKELEGYTGADIEALVREAGLNALRKDMKTKMVTKRDFDMALKQVAPSIKPDLVKFYDKVAEAFKAPAVRKKSRKEEELESYVG